MARTQGVTRREFVAAAGGVAAAALLPGANPVAAAAGTRRRYAIVGTGVRGIGMWGRPLVSRYPDVLEFVGLCDVNPLRAEYAKKTIGVSCPTFTSLDEMLTKAKPDLLCVTTVDATHSECIVKALERGVDVITEKPMTIDEAQCQAVLDAEKRTGRKIGVTFNYRYSPKHQKIKETAPGRRDRPGDQRRLLLVPRHHARRRLLPPLAPPPRRRAAPCGCTRPPTTSTSSTGGSTPTRWRSPPSRASTSTARRGHSATQNCRSCPKKSECSYYWDITKDPRLVALYVDCEKADGYLRDGCVFKEDVDIPDTMNAVVRYSNGVNMSYSLNTFMPIEGYRLAFNGTKGRLEVRDYERQPWEPGEETEIYVMRNFGPRVKIEIPKAEGGHGGGDDRLRDLIFRKVDAPEYMKLPGSRAGAMSCLTGIAARKSADSGRPVKIADLVRL